jgi:hypothetical protein
MTLNLFLHDRQHQIETSTASVEAIMSYFAAHPATLPELPVATHPNIYIVDDTRKFISISLEKLRYRRFKIRERLAVKFALE